MDGVFLKMSVQGVSPKIPVGPSLIRSIGRSVEEKSTTGSRWVSRRPFEFLRIGGKRRKGTVRDDAVLSENGNWVLKILEVGSIWKGKRQRSGGGGDGEEEEEVTESEKSDDDLCDFCSVDEEEEEEEMMFDREEFSKMLMKVDLGDAQMFAKLSYLGNLAYSIPKIKPENLLKYQKLKFVTSSIEKRMMNLKASSEQQEENNNDDKEEEEKKKLIDPTVAYRIAASAASRLFSHSKTVLPFGSSKRQEKNEASLMATADSVTVAAK